MIENHGFINLLWYFKILIEQLTEYYEDIYRSTLVIVGLTVLVYGQGMLRAGASK